MNEQKQYVCPWCGGKDVVEGIQSTYAKVQPNKALTLKEVHEQQGVGIGLYLAREIVTRQGGYIKVVSEPGKGSEFSIMLPTK